MLPVARHEVIVEAVSVGQAVSTDDLVRRLGVSAETVRRDLALLEEHGAIGANEEGAFDGRHGAGSGTVRLEEPG